MVVFELGLLYSCWEGWRQRKEPNILICLVTQPPVLLLVNSNSNIQESHLLKISRNFPGDPVVNTALLLWEAQVQSLVRELRSRMPRGTAKKKKKFLESEAQTLDYFSCFQPLPGDPVSLLASPHPDEGNRQLLEA